MEKERSRRQTEADRFYTMLMTEEKEQQSTMMNMEMKKTDFTRIIS